MNYEPCNYTTNSEHTHHLDPGWIALPSAPLTVPPGLPKTYFPASGFTTYSAVVSSAPAGAFVQHVANLISNISSVSAGPNVGPPALPLWARRSVARAAVQTPMAPPSPPFCSSP